MAVKKMIQKNARYFAVLGIILLLIVMFGATSKNFFSWGTFFNFIRQNAVLYIACIAMTLPMLTGGLDLSIGATGAFAAMTSALFMQNMGKDDPWTGAVCFLLVILVGAVIGSINGFFVGYLKISPFMTTLAMQAVASGATFAISGNNRIIVTNQVYTWLGQTTIPLNLGDTTGKLPVSIFLVIAVVIFSFILVRKMSFGRKIYATGGNVVAAKCSGINTRKVTLLTYMTCSILMCLASIIWVGRTSAATPTQGSGLEFSVLTAIIIGGCSLAGGVGTLLGTFLGAVLLGVISTGLGMVDTAPYVIYWIQGALIIAAVYIDTNLGIRQSKVKPAAKAEVHAVHAAHASNREQVLELIAKNKQTTLELSGISKQFPGVQALDNVSMKIERGRVHAIMGENGAGKSTLMKILTGVYTRDTGEIKINGIPINIRSPIEARKLGISIIYQEFALVPYMSVSQNVYMGKEMRSKIWPFIDRAKMRRESEKLLAKVNLNINVDEQVAECRVGQQQMIEIGKAIGSNAWVVVMDEPTAAITDEEEERLFDIIRELKAQGVAIVYISHRMSEIFKIADDITVLRDGKHVITAPTCDFSENLLIKHMVGRELSDIFNREKADRREPVLEVKNLTRYGAFDPISFSVRAGEVLGFSGLIGAGRTEIMRCLFGLDKSDGGEIYINGKRVNISSPEDAIKAGLCLVSEDRRREGIVPPMTVRENITMPSLKKLSTLGWVDEKKDAALAIEYIEKLSIRTPTPEQKIRNLSGGNQQKVCLARWLALSPKVIILDEPTRGIDVGAKMEIHKLIEGLAKAGMAVILISSELPEILGASDRIIVLNEGRQTGEFEVDPSVTQEVIMASATGVVKSASNC
jgi:ribose transport system ATP-binding protein